MGDTSDAAVEALLDAVDAATDTPSVIEVSADDAVDPEILALLADDTTPAEPVAVSDPDMTEGAEEIVAEDTDDVEVEIEPSDEEAIEAALAEEETTEPTAAAPSAPKRQKAATAPVRMFTDVAAIDPAAFKDNLDGITAKKVNEKVSNLIQSVERGSKLSNYTAIAVKALVADGKVSGSSLVKTFESAGLSTGTARAQAQQMTALFKAVGLATPDATAPRELVLADKTLADELVLIAA